MTINECYIFGMKLINRSANGDFPVQRFNEFFNRAQDEYMGEITGDGHDESIMGDKRISPFLVRRTVQIDSHGIGTHNPTDDLAWGPVVWISGYRNPSCGETATGDPMLIPARRHTPSSWPGATRNLIDVVSYTDPIWMRYDARKLQVRPTNLGFVFAHYIRFANRVSVGSFIDANGIERPLEGAPNQIDPEWANPDAIEITWKAMGYTGLTLQSDRVQATAARQLQK